MTDDFATSFPHYISRNIHLTLQFPYDKKALKQEIHHNKD